MSLWLNRESKDGRRSIVAVEGLAPIVLGASVLIVFGVVSLVRSCG
ncbi:MAG: hypothetical protein K8S98_02365 [Planctomycetes bacterium]|nr:hypothetical protein [Planctomycetota bacterium]